MIFKLILHFWFTHASKFMLSVSFPPPFTYQFALHITIISLIIMLLIIIIGIIILQEVMKLRLGNFNLLCFCI